VIKRIAKMGALFGPLALACEEILAAAICKGFLTTTLNVVGAVAAVICFVAVAAVTQIDEELVSGE